MTPGVVTVSDVELAAITGIKIPLIETEFSLAVEEKPEPVTVISVPLPPADGEKEVIVGELGPLVTVNDALLAEPFVLLTAIGPEVALEGTVVVKIADVALATVADVPLNVTAFELGVVRNPDPRIVTLVPTGPLDGEIAETVS
jgi:hypothetical protein